jgi:hypothetical protein
MAAFLQLLSSEKVYVCLEDARYRESGNITMKRVHEHTQTSSPMGVILSSARSNLV